MNKSNTLHELIIQLSSHEKRYVKAFISERKKEENDYLELFDLINDQKKYNEEELKNKFSDRLFIQQLDVKKYYLYELLLNALQNYNYKRSDRENLLTQAKILINKNLFFQANERLKKGLVIAKNSEDYLYEIQLLELQSELVAFLDSIDRKKLVKKISEAASKYNNWIHFNNLYIDFQSILDKSTFVRTSKQKRAYDLILASDYLSSEKKATTFKSLMYYYNIHYLYQGSLGNWKKAYEYSKKMYDKIVIHPQSTAEFSIMYLNACASYMGISLLGDGSRQEFNKVKNKLYKDKAKFSSEYLEVLAQTRLYQYEVIALKSLGDLTEVRKAVLEMVQFLEENSTIIESNKLKFLYFDVGKTFYKLGDQRNTNKWLLKATYSNDNQIKPDIYVFSKILYLINLIEMKETELIKQNVQSLRRQMKNLGVFYSLESFLLSFISNEYVKWNDLPTKEKVELMNQFLKKYLHEMKKEWNKNSKMYFDFESWARSRIE